MGNHSSREDSEGTDLLISKCPGRNRNLSNLTNKDGSKAVNSSRKYSNKEDISFNIICLNDQKQILASQNYGCKSFNDDIERHMKPSHKMPMKRKRQSKNLQSRRFELEAENSSEAANLECYQKLRVRKRQKPKNEEQQNFGLILNIMETIANLEATFIEEKKYERRLFTAVEAQIQEIQRFNILLDKEKSQNKKLLALLDCSTEVYEPNIERDQFTTESYEKSNLQIVDRKIFSRNLSSSMSPLLLQQKCDELAANLNHCKIELSNKNKEFILTQYKLDELQGNCDSLNKELQVSYQRIETLGQEIVFLKQERKQLKKSLRSLKQTENLKSGVGGNFTKKDPHECLKAEDAAVTRRTYVMKAKAE